MLLLALPVGSVSSCNVLLGNWVVHLGRQQWNVLRRQSLPAPPVTSCLGMGSGAQQGKTLCTPVSGGNNCYKWSCVSEPVVCHLQMQVQKPADNCVFIYHTWDEIATVSILAGAALGCVGHSSTELVSFRSFKSDTKTCASGGWIFSLWELCRRMVLFIEKLKVTFVVQIFYLQPSKNEGGED